MAELHEIEVTAAGWRADKLIAEALPELSRSAVQNLIRDGHVTCDNKIVQKSAKLAPGSVLCVEIPEARPLDVKAENIPLDIVYEDDDLLVVNKPKGMVVHPAAGNYDGTLVNALLYHCGDSLSGINGVIRPGIVHRIDKNTSGLLIVAKNDTAHRHLAEQIKAHSFTREYRAVVYGKIREDGTVDAPIARHPQDRKRMAVQNTPNARNAVTHYLSQKILRDLRSCACALRPDARTRSVCTWRISGILSRATRSTDRKKSSRSCMGSACTRGSSGSSTRARANIWSLKRRCRHILRIL